MRAKLTSNEIMPNTKKNIIEMCACQPGINNLGSEKRRIFIKTSGGVKRFFVNRGGVKSNRKKIYFEVEFFPIITYVSNEVEHSGV